MPCFLETPFPLPIVVNAGGPTTSIEFDTADHREIADLGAALDRSRNPGD